MQSSFTPLNSAASLQYLLSDKEIKVKTALWMAENSDYLKEQKGTSRMQLDVCAGCVSRQNLTFICLQWPKTYLLSGKQS